MHFVRDTLTIFCLKLLTNSELAEETPKQRIFPKVHSFYDTISKRKILFDEEEHLFLSLYASQLLLRKYHETMRHYNFPFE